MGPKIKTFEKVKNIDFNFYPPPPPQSQRLPTILGKKDN
jgi:hypothetical protein